MALTHRVIRAKRMTRGLIALCCLCLLARAAWADSTPAGMLLLPSDPDAQPVEPLEMIAAFELGSDGNVRIGTDVPATATGLRTGCPDVGFSQRAYARDTGNDWPWLPANTLVADDLTLEPGVWRIGCYDVLIYADNDPNYGCNVSREVSLRAYDDCNGTLIPGSQETWTVPPHGGPVLLTGATNVDFIASGTIWFGMITASNECDGWYIGQVQANGSTANVFQLGTECDACINAPSCSPWSGFIVVLYGCKLPQITTQPQDATICAGGSQQLCVSAVSDSALEYQWKLDGVDIGGATSPCYVASAAGEYTCLVSNGCGETLSESATLTVSTGPTITADPVGDIICPADSPHTVCVTAEGIGTLHYQWRRNGLTIIGATNACYDAAVPGAYRCTVTDDCGSTESNAGNVLLASPATADFNGSGACDLADFMILVDCLAGPNGTPTGDCACVDTNSDSKIDLQDFAVLQDSYAD